jgi:hypothetical protein
MKRKKLKQRKHACQRAVKLFKSISKVAKALQPIIILLTTVLTLINC